MRSDDQSERPSPRQHEKLPYEPPRIAAYDVPGLLDVIGPASACIRWDMIGYPGEPPDRHQEEDLEEW